MFEFDIVFPFESRLSISVEDHSGLFVNSEIGRTEIDLENRFYSKCYATCGIQKNYTPNGYNFWRDSLLPTELLNKMCKLYRIAPPFYETDGTLVIEAPDFKNDEEVRVTHRFPYKDERFKNENNDEDKKFQESDGTKIKKDEKHIEQQALNVLNSWKSITEVKFFK